jgi:hypothetical protein
MPNYGEQDFVLRTHLHVLKIFQGFKYGCKKSKISGKIHISMALFFSPYIHQDDDLFCVQSRGNRLVKNNIE